MRSEFYKEIENKVLDLSTDDEYALFEIYTSWICKLFKDLGIKNKLAWDHEKYCIELFNCPWISHWVKNPIFCINCHAMISCSFKWINLIGKINKTSTIADNSSKCTFIIH